MDALLATGPEPIRLRGAQAAKPSAEADSGQPLDAGVGKGVVTLPDTADEADANSSRQLGAGEPMLDELSARRDAAELIDRVQETSHPMMVRLRTMPRPLRAEVSAERAEHSACGGQLDYQNSGIGGAGRGRQRSKFRRTGMALLVRLRFRTSSTDVPMA